MFAQHFAGNASNQCLPFKKASTQNYAPGLINEE